jgi:membrane associated rhomboid family serine protease
MRRLVSEPLRRFVSGPPETTLRVGLVVVALGFIFGIVGVFCVHVFSQRATSEQEPDTGPGEAVAALAGVIVGIGAPRSVTPPACCERNGRSCNATM